MDTHEWGNNVIIVQGNGTIKTILVNKKLGVETKWPQTLVRYDLFERITNEKEDMIFEIEPELLSIGIIIISNEIVSLLSIKVSKVKISGESDLEQETLDQGVEEVMFSTTNTTKFHVKPNISLENKVYP